MVISSWSSNDSPGERVRVGVGEGVGVGDGVFVAVGVYVYEGVKVLVIVGLAVGVAVCVDVRVVVEVRIDVFVIEGWRVDVGPDGVVVGFENEHARLRIPSIQNSNV